MSLHRHRRLMRRPFAYTTAFLLLTTCLYAGCVPSIGDECNANGDCPTSAICDSTAPGGYCTIPECTIGSCPGDSLCVEFDRETAFCMTYCEDDSDCRDGYTCRDDTESRAYCYVPDESDETGEPQRSGG